MKVLDENGLQLLVNNLNNEFKKIIAYTYDDDINKLNYLISKSGGQSQEIAVDDSDSKGYLCNNGDLYIVGTEVASGRLTSYVNDIENIYVFNGVTTIAEDAFSGIEATIFLPSTVASNEN